MATFEATNTGLFARWDTGSYLTAHDAADANVDIGIVLNNYGFRVGQADSYNVYRAGLVFDTSSIPSDATINGATLSLMGETNAAEADFDITIVSGTDLADTFVVADYGDLLNEITSLGSLTTVGFLLEGWNVLTISDLTKITKAGITRFGLRSSRDISSTPTVAYEYVVCYGSNTTNKKPRLTVTYNFTPKIFYF